MEQKEVNITFVGPDKVVQHIHSIKKIKTTKKKDIHLLPKKLVEDIDSDDDFINLIPEKNVIKSQTFATNQNELMGSDIFGFKTPKRSSLKKSSSLIKKNCKKTPKLNKDNYNNGDDDHEKLDDDNYDDGHDNEEDQLEMLHNNKKTSRNKNKIDHKNEVDTAIIDEFFDEEKSASRTSDKTLCRLPKLDPLQLQDILSRDVFLYEEERTDLCRSYRKNFDKWMLEFKYGYNILLYGLGSKLNILQEFANEYLSDYNLLVINGFFPSLTYKSIFSGICDLIGLNLTSLAPHQLIDAIQKCLDIKDEDLFVVIHNLDGVSLRGENLQNNLSWLAKLTRVHLIASIDHINAPLMWDQMKLNCFSFLWYDTTTFLPYINETCFEGSLLITSSGSLEISSLTHILSSLTQNANKIFLILANNQMGMAGEQNIEGYAFEDLYMRCREEFLVNSEATLRAQLSEFIDHKLIRIKKDIDGTECVNITVDRSSLSQYIENREDVA